MYTHMVLQSITTINPITKQKHYQVVAVYWGTKSQCEEFVMENNGNFRITEMDKEESHYYNYKY